MPCGYVYSIISKRASVIYGCVYHILREASASLLVQLYRAIQSLRTWNEQQVWLSRFFCCIARIVSHWHNKYYKVDHIYRVSRKSVGISIDVSDTEQKELLVNNTP